jgi:hypothetical protein
VTLEFQIGDRYWIERQRSCGGNRLNSGQRRRRSRTELCPLWELRVPGVWQRQPNHREMRTVETGINPLQQNEASDKQTSRSEQLMASANSEITRNERKR